MKRRSFLQLLGISVAFPNLLFATNKPKVLSDWERIKANATTSFIIKDEFNSYSKFASTDFERLMQQARSQGNSVMLMQQSTADFKP